MSNAKALAVAIVGSVACGLASMVLFVVTMADTPLFETHPTQVGKDPTRADRRIVDAMAVETGDCFSDKSLLDVDSGLAPTTVVVSPCRQPHHGEVVGTLRLRGDRFPGEAAVDRRAEKCYDAFASYLGVPSESSQFQVTWFYVNAETWALGQRTIVCVAHEPGFLKRRGSLRDARR